MKWRRMFTLEFYKRRKEAGFGQTVEQNAARIGITYRVIKMNEVK